MVLSRKIRKATGCYSLKDKPFISPPEHCNEQEKTRNSECRDTHREDPSIQEPLAHTSEASPAALAKQHQRSPPGPPVWCQFTTRPWWWSQQTGHWWASCPAGQYIHCSYQHLLPAPSHFSCLETETRLSLQGYGSWLQDLGCLAQLVASYEIKPSLLSKSTTTDYFCPQLVVPPHTSYCF